jgi:hypothetical protein
MKFTALIITLFLIGCANDPNTAINQVKVFPQFQSSQSGFQDIQASVLTKVQASYLSIGDYTEYNSSTSTWIPNLKGQYYIDSQVVLQGIYTSNYVTAYVILMYEGQPYFTEPTVFNVPINQQTQIRIQTNSLIPFDGVTDSVSAWVYVSQASQIISEQSQFEGYYVGSAAGTPAY